MPLSKERNRDRMRLIRRNKRSLSPQERKSVQPTPVRPEWVICGRRDNEGWACVGKIGKEGVAEALLVDADGNVIPEE